MKIKIRHLALLALVCILFAAPVAACAVAIEKSGPAEVCKDCEFTYTLKVFYEGNAGYMVKATDVLPAGLTYVTSSKGGTYNSITRTVCWTFSPTPSVPYNADRNKWWNNTVTITVRPDGTQTSFTNKAKAWSRPPYQSSWSGEAKSSEIKTKTVPCYTEITKTASDQACVDCDLTYSIHVSYKGLGNQYVRITDTLADGVSYGSSSDAGSYNAGRVTWDFGPVPDGWTKDLTLTVTPGSTGSLKNSVEARLATGSSSGSYVFSNVSVPWVTEIIPCTPSPEFPVTGFPVLVLAALLGSVAFLKRK